MMGGHPKAEKIKVRQKFLGLLSRSRLTGNVTGNIPCWRLWVQRIFEAMSRGLAPRYSDHSAS